MQAGHIAQLDAPADAPLEDTTENDQSLPALAVNSTQTDLDGEGTIQHCTAGARVAVEREEALVYDGGITTDRVEGRRDVVADLVADVTGSGIVLAERTAGSGRYPFPYDLVVAQTGRDITHYTVDTEAFVASFDADALRDTWMVGTEDTGGDGVTIDYGDRAKPTDAPQASIGLGFSLIWRDIHAEGVVYASGYVAVYSSWTAEVFAEFVTDAVLPHVTPEDAPGEQTTL